VVRKRAGLIGLVLVIAVIAAACNFAGFDPGMGRRCIFGENFAFTSDCPGATTASPHWELWSDNDRNVGMFDIKSNTWINSGSKLQTTWLPPNSLVPDIKGYIVEAQIQPGIDPGNVPANEVNLQIQNGMSHPLAGLHSLHTIKMYSHSGYYDVEYGIWFTNPNNNQVYILNYVLGPNNPNTSVDKDIIFHGCAYHCGQPDHNDVIKINAHNAFGTPNILGNGYTTIDIDWGKVLDFVHARGWWTDIPSSINVWREWFQAQSWAIGSSTAGGVDTFQGNWTIYYN
jgi:hypothetical protein